MTREESLRAIERELGVLLRRVRRAIGVRARAVHPDLAPAAYLALAHLEQAGPMRASAAAEELGIDKGALSRQLTHLEGLGLLTRSADPDDGRAALVAVSEDGRTRLEEVRRARSARFDQRLGTWSDEELAGFAAELGRYNVALED